MTTNIRPRRRLASDLTPSQRAFLAAVRALIGRALRVSAVRRGSLESVHADFVAGVLLAAQGALRVARDEGRGLRAVPGGGELLRTPALELGPREGAAG